MSVFVIIMNTLQQFIKQYLTYFMDYVKDLIDFVYCHALSFECMNSDCILYEVAIKKLFETKIHNSELLAGYCQWENIVKSLKKKQLKEPFQIAKFTKALVSISAACIHSNLYTGFFHHVKKIT